MPTVVIAIRNLSIAIERILIIFARQFAAEIVGADAMRPRVVRQHADVIGEAMVRLQQQARYSWTNVAPSSVCMIVL